jgi:hypothetical protein
MKSRLVNVSGQCVALLQPMASASNFNVSAQVVVV